MTSKAVGGHRRVEKESRGAQLSRRAVYAIVLFLTAAASFHGFYAKMGFQDAVSTRNFEAIIDGTAARPYIYRQFVPATANLADRIAPEGLKERLAALRSDDGRGLYASLFSSPTAQNPTYSFRYLVFYLVAFAGAPVAAILFYLVCRTEGYTPEIALISASLMILLIPYIQTRGGGHYEDFLEAAFIALAVLLARNAHWLWLVPVAFLGTLNKESFALVLLALWPLLKDRSNRIRALRQVLSLEVVGISVYLYTRSRFAGNPGGTVEFHLWDQIHFFAQPGLWLLKFGKVYGIYLPELGTIVPAIVLGWMIWRSWKELARPVRQYGWLTAGMNFPLFLLLCNSGEVRDLSLLYLIVLLCIAATLSRSSRSLMMAPGDSGPWRGERELESWASSPFESGVPHVCE